MSQTVTNSSSEQQYDPTTWVPEPENHGTRDLWKVFIYLTVITVVDVIIYFVWQPELGSLLHLYKNLTFVILGLVKAFYIVGTFMHLKYEKMNLILTIILPIFFIIFFIIWMLYEGNEWGLLN
jgi:cytochrome c oxidase subunit 4